VAHDKGMDIIYTKYCFNEPEQPIFTDANIGKLVSNFEMREPCPKSLPASASLEYNTNDLLRTT